MTTSYLVPWFLTDCTEIEHENRSFFLSDFLLHHYSNFRYFRFWIITVLWKIKKKNKQKKREKRLGIIYPKNYENFKNRKSGSNFTGSYEKVVHQARILHYGKVLAYILAYVAMVFTYHLNRLWLLLCPLFKIGKA